MKKIIFCLLIMFSTSAFSQTDSSHKTDKIFYISYLNFDKETEILEDARLTELDSITLICEYVILGQNSNMNKSASKKIVLDRINKFGYKTGTNLLSRIGYGAGIGFVVGAVIGAFGTGTVTGDGHVPPGTYSLPVGLICAVPGALIGVVTGVGKTDYEIVDITKYDRIKKFEIIKRLIRNGVKENE